jgi:hypothetical protein
MWWREGAQQLRIGSDGFSSAQEGLIQRCPVGLIQPAPDGEDVLGPAQKSRLVLHSL